MSLIEKHFKHIEYIYMSVTLGIIFFGILLIGYWQFYPDNIITLTKPVTLDKTIYYPGDRLIYTVSYCKTRKISGEVIRALVNGTRIAFTTITSDLPIGCNTVKISDLVIPDYIDTDTYHIETTVQYKINPIRNFIISWKSKEFRVIK